MKVIGMDHIVLRVRDREESLRFYGDVLGLEKLRAEEWREGKVGFPSVRVSEGTIIDLMEQSPEAVEPGRAPGRNLDHFCLVVAREAWDGYIAELQRTGAAPVEEPKSRWGARGRGVSIYIHDPDGNEIELKTYTG